MDAVDFGGGDVGTTGEVDGFSSDMGGDTSSHFDNINSRTRDDRDVVSNSLNDSKHQRKEEPDQEKRKEAAQEKRKWKLRVYDQDHELDEAELIKKAQLGFASDKKFQEASRIQKEYEPLMKGLRSQDRAEQIQTLKQLMKGEGDDRPWVKIAEDLLLEEIEYNSLSKSEKDNLQLKRENASLKEFKEQQERAKQEQAQQEALRFAQQEINDEISDVLKSLGSKPTPRLVKRMAEEMLAHLDARGGRMKAADAMNRAVSGIETDISEYLSTLPADKLRQVLPPKVLQALRKANVEDVQTMQGNRIGRTKSQSSPRPNKKFTTQDYFSNLEKKFGG